MAKLSQISSKNKWLADRTQGRRGLIADFMENTVSPPPPPRMLVYQKKIRVGGIGQNTANFTKNKVLVRNEKGRQQKVLTC